MTQNYNMTAQYQELFITMEGEVRHKRCLSQTKTLQIHIGVLLMAILLIYIHFEDYSCIQIRQAMTTFKYM